MAVEIIPAIDVIGGKCVRLTQGDYNQKKEYHDDPLEVAKAFEGAGVRRLHLVDLDGAKAKHVVNLSVLERISAGTSLTVDFGGGVKSDEDIEAVFNAGAAQVTGGSIAVKSPEVFSRWLEHYGSEKIILGADARDGYIAVSGWQEMSDRTLIDFVKGYHQKGARYVISTDVAKDGLMQGPSFELYEDLMHHFPDMKVIASGGVRHMDDIKALEDIGVYGVIIGKSFYEGAISLQNLEDYYAH